MKWRPATFSFRSVPGPCDRAPPRGPRSTRPAGCVSSAACLQAATGSVLVGEAGAVVEVLVVGEAHRGGRGVGVGREEGHVPAQLAGGAALHHPLHQRLHRLLAQRLPLRRDRSESSRRVRPERIPDPGVGLARSPSAAAARSTRSARRWPARRRRPAAPSISRSTIGWPPASSASLVDRLDQRLGRDAALDRAGLARLRAASRVARPAPAPGPSTRGSLIRLRLSPRGAPLAGAGRHRHQQRVQARSRRSARDGRSRRAPRPRRIATGCPSHSHSTSTSGPASSIHGARMKTARIGSVPIPSISSSASKLCSWRPKALRRARASIRPRWSRVADDHPRAGAEDRPPGAGVRRGSARRGRRARSPS